MLKAAETAKIEQKEKEAMKPEVKKKVVKPKPTQLKFKSEPSEPVAQGQLS